MNRSDKLKELHSIEIGTELTYMPEEGALECEYVTPEGYVSEWIGPDEWPAYKILSMNKDRFTEIKNKVKVKELEIKDIKGTAFDSIFQQVYFDEIMAKDKAVLNEFFSTLTDLDFPEDGTMYALYYEGDKGVRGEFFSNYQDFKKSFASNCIIDVTTWEEMDDKELDFFIRRMGSSFYEITCNEFDFEDEE